MSDLSHSVTGAIPALRGGGETIPPARRAYREILGERRDIVRAELATILSDHASDIVWEIGSGHGHFLTAYAAAHPARLCIGVDIESNRIERANKKRDRAKLSHLHFIRAEARLFLQALPSGARISEVFILFPDPWPKSRHHKHRILQSKFLRELASYTTPDCRLCFRTDHHDYFVEALAAAHSAAEWQVVPEAWPFEYSTVFQSRAPAYESFVARRRPQ